MESISFRSKRQKVQSKPRNIKVIYEKERIYSKSTYFINKNDDWYVLIDNLIIQKTKDETKRENVYFNLVLPYFNTFYKNKMQ